MTRSSLSEKFTFLFCYGNNSNLMQQGCKLFTLPALCASSIRRWFQSQWIRPIARCICSFVTEIEQSDKMKFKSESSLIQPWKAPVRTDFGTSEYDRSVMLLAQTVAWTQTDTDWLQTNILPKYRGPSAVDPQNSSSFRGHAWTSDATLAVQIRINWY